MSCINDKIGNKLEFYLFNKLTESEKLEFEEHLFECKFCYEQYRELFPAIQTMLENTEFFRAELDKSINILKKNEDVSTENTVIGSPIERQNIIKRILSNKLTYYSAAASVILVFGLYLTYQIGYFYGKDDSYQNNRIAERGERLWHHENFGDTVNNPLGPDSHRIRESQPLPDEQIASIDLSSLPDDSRNPWVLSTQFSTDRPATNEKFESALRIYREGNKYSHALEKFLSCERNETSNFYIAMCYLYLGEFTSSIHIINQMGKITNSDIKDLVYKALAHNLINIRRQEGINRISLMRNFLNNNYSRDEIQSLENTINNINIEN
ncbi:MAG: hypothetical protein V1779_07930 [bacterium]